MILVDSSVWIDYLNGVRAAHVDRLDALLDSHEIAIGDLILAEVLQGLRSETDARRVLRFLDPLPCLELGGRDNAVRAAHHYRRLRQRGRTVRKTIDVLIGSYCIGNDIALLHNDRDFDAMRDALGLVVVEMN